METKRIASFPVYQFVVGQVDMVMDMLKDGAVSPANAYAYLLNTRKLYPEGAVRVNVALKALGEKHGGTKDIPAQVLTEKEDAAVCEWELAMNPRPYVTSFERSGFEEGLQQSIMESIEKGISPEVARKHLISVRKKRPEFGREIDNVMKLVDKLG